MATERNKYHGIKNQGATCYLNSVLQVLYLTKDFREKVKSYSSQNSTKHIDNELRDLFTVLENREANTNQITKKLQIKKVWEQRDAAEHYEKILRLTSPDASQMRPCPQIFHGELINYNTCQKCQERTRSAARFWNLPLPLINSSNYFSVEKGIADFFSSSEISGDDQMYCEKCDEKCDAVLHCEVSHHPEVLVLLLKRFEFDYNFMTYVKINQPVDVPHTVYIPQFADHGQNNQKVSYNLYAFVEHFGELRYGHYTSTVQSQENGQWYYFDDSSVGNLEKTLPKMERSQSAYLLFYRKQKRLKRSLVEPALDPPVNVKKTKHELSAEELPLHPKCPDNKELNVDDCSSGQQAYNMAAANQENKEDNKIVQKCIDHHISSGISQGSNEHTVKQEPQPEEKQQCIPKKIDALSQLSQNKDQWHRHGLSESEVFNSENMTSSSREVLMNAVGDDGGANSDTDLRNEYALTGEVQAGQGERQESYRIKICVCDSEPNQGKVCETGDNCCEGNEGCGSPHSCTDVHMEADQREHRDEFSTQEVLGERSCEDVHMEADQVEQEISQENTVSGIGWVREEEMRNIEDEDATDKMCSLEEKDVNNAKDENVQSTEISCEDPKLDDQLGFDENELSTQEVLGESSCKDFIPAQNICNRSQTEDLDESNKRIRVTKKGVQNVCSDYADDPGKKNVHERDSGETKAYKDPCFSISAKLHSHSGLNENELSTQEVLGESSCKDVRMEVDHVEQEMSQENTVSGIRLVREEKVGKNIEDEGATDKMCSLEEKDVNTAKDENVQSTEIDRGDPILHNQGGFDEEELSTQEVLGETNNICNRSQTEDLDESNKRITITEEGGEKICSDSADLGEKSVHEGYSGQPYAYKDPCFSISEKCKDYEQSPSTIQDVKEHFTKHDQKMDTEQVGMAEGANLQDNSACMEGQVRTGRRGDAKVTSEGTGRKEGKKPLLTIYDLCRQQNIQETKNVSDCYERQPERLHTQIFISENQKAQEGKYSQPEDCLGAAKIEVEESEQINEQRSVDASTSGIESEQRETVGQSKGHRDRLLGRVFQSLVVIMDGETETKRYTLNKKHSGKDERRDAMRVSGQSKRNEESPSETLAEGVVNLTLGKGQDVEMETKEKEISRQVSGKMEGHAA